MGSPDVSINLIINCNLLPNFIISFSKVNTYIWNRTVGSIPKLSSLAGGFW